MAFNWLSWKRKKSDDSKETIVWKKRAVTIRKRAQVSYLWHGLFLMFPELRFLQQDNRLFLAFDFLQLKEEKTTIKLTVQFVNERKMCFEEEIFFFFYFLKFHFCSDRRCVLTQCNSHINFIVGPFSHSRWKTITDFIWTKWIEQSHHSMQMVAVFLSPCVEARER